MKFNIFFFYIYKKLKGPKPQKKLSTKSFHSYTLETCLLELSKTKLKYFSKREVYTFYKYLKWLKKIRKKPTESSTGQCLSRQMAKVFLQYIL